MLHHWSKTISLLYEYCYAQLQNRFSNELTESGDAVEKHIVHVEKFLQFLYPVKWNNKY